MRQRTSESGQAIVWVAVMLPLFLSVIGLAIDGGIVFSARRELQNVADSAARAGATQIDERRYRDSGGTVVAIAKGPAEELAAGAIQTQAADVEAAIAADQDRVVVQVWREVPTSFLRLANIDTVRVGAKGEARVLRGIREGG